MGEIVGLVALSHSPFFDPANPPLQGPGAIFSKAVAEIRKQAAALKPDTLVVFGPDHFRNFFYDLMPPFSVGVEQVDSFGDYFTTPKGSLPVAAPLAKAICAGVMEMGFDPAISYSMGIDHGLSQPFAAVRSNSDVKMVPIVVNTNASPRPSLRRCYEFGKAVSAAIKAHDSQERVLVVGSGGLSHWPPSNSMDNPNLTQEMREYAIAGRRSAVENSAKRDQSFLARRNSANGRVNPQWDNWLLEKIKAGDLEPVLAQTSEDILRDGGTGGPEIACWIAALGAWGRPVTFTGYEPTPEWVTGMGCVAGFSLNHG